MNHACVCGGFAVPNSAVPVLPNVPGGNPAPAAVPSPCTTLAMNVRNVAATFGGSAPTFGTVAAGSVVRTGACHCPDATVAATDAICAGLATTRACPIADAPNSTRSLGAGY